VKNYIDKLKDTAKAAFRITEVRYSLWAVLTVLLAECLSVGPLRAAVYPFVRPLPFLAAAVIVFTSYAITLLFKRRIGAFILVEGIWLGIAVANCILLSYRVNPLSAVDFSIFFSVFSIITVYLSVVHIILICVAILAAITLAVYFSLRLPSSKPDYKKVIIKLLFCIVICACVVLTSVLVHRTDMKKMNLPEAYREYGFVYCFSLSTADRGIDKPGEYSEDSVSDILNELENGKDEGKTDGVNVIMVQLESFMDTEYIKNLETGTDPIPNFRKLRDAFPSGKLTVPVAGAGTVNTEFEVLCGIPISSFGLGEYPYETVLQEVPCESIAYYLAEAGYVTHAIHNHTGTFYNRYAVMEKLGFETFTPVEFMSDVRRNSLGWAKDSHLTGEIMAALSSTDTSDFVYAISVQPHGKYVTEEGDYGDIEVSGKFDEATLAAMDYYVNQLYETDRFVGELISELSMFGEDTVVVFFGDHQPSLGIGADDIEGGSIYTTEYVIWSNFGHGGEDKDLYSYELSAYLLGKLGIEGGVISRFHRDMVGKDGYLTDLEHLAYDLLFGEKYAYGGAFPYKVPDIRYGVRDVKATGAYVHNDTLYVMGEGFTEASSVMVDGRERETIYINPNLIVCSGIKSAQEIYVLQMSRDGFEFSRVSCPKALEK